MQPSADPNQLFYNHLCIPPFLLLTKQFKFNRFIMYNSVVILLKSQEVRQLFEFHKEKQMWCQGLTLMEFGLWGGVGNLALLRSCQSLVCSSHQMPQAGWARKDSLQSFVLLS